MIFEGQAIKCKKIDGDIIELTFDLKDESVNKFNKLTLQELSEAVDKISQDSSAKGLLVTSAKSVFIVGADITEFIDFFKKPAAEIAEGIKAGSRVFSKLEDLNIPSVVAINGFALGGGFEFCLSCTYRVMSTDAKVGLPEVKLGILPGWGGTVRLPRVIGADNAIEWICMGKENKAEEALKTGAVDAVVAPDKTRESALQLLNHAISGKLDWKARRQEKLEPLKLGEIESTMVFEGTRGFIAAQAGPHYPSPLTIVGVMQAGSKLGRDDALEIEAEGFSEVATTSVAQSLISLFMGDQLLKKKAKSAQKAANPVKSAAVLGAGIMGGGIAYQSAFKGTPIHMKDINDAAIQLGLNEATKLLDGQVSKGRLTTKKMADTLNSIYPTLSYDGLKNVDIVVEAVVENPKIKKMVLAETEGYVRADTVLSSNTSTISISYLAEGLKRPEMFCGMHFFNPVHKMPLVEVIRGKKSSEKAIATTVAYATAMGKTAIVVNDCPGFLVNRILFPYFAGFQKLVSDGVDFKRVDKIMEKKFGWPMGPAYLLDVVGIDTAHHAGEVMAEGFPDRMKPEGRNALDVMYENKRFGQKNNQGFYLYSLDKKGKPKKSDAPEVADLLKPVIHGDLAGISDDEIIDRMMIPMIIESSRCLEDNIVSSAAELDMGLIFGIGFPPFRGGALNYADTVGIAKICEKADKYASLGKVYEPTEQMRQLAKSGKTFYQS
ncbi:MAG: fatty acid oxidation complex subunit alpha FadB [SAR324 cluster bacterium]|nr:fatty acid oxidation complex subunit alpha FadB [SAR324 cluster bacterium]